MKCKTCGLEMYVDKVTTDGNNEIFHNKCRNPNCYNFGYSVKNDDILQPQSYMENEIETVKEIDNNANDNRTAAVGKPTVTHQSGYVIRKRRKLVDLKCMLTR